MRANRTSASHFTLGAGCLLVTAALLGCAGQAPQSPMTTTPAENPTTESSLPPATGTQPVAAPQETAQAVTIKSLRANPAAGTHTIDVWVIKLKPCPECPPPLSCKPCLGDFIMVADDATPSSDDAQVGVLVPASALSQFQAGKRYRIEVDVNKGVPDSTSLAKVELVRLVSTL